MADIKTAMIDGFAAFIEAQKATPETRVTLVTFDAPHYGGGMDITGAYTAKPVAEVPALVLEPRGGTPLYDALVVTIDATGRRLSAIPEKDRPTSVVFVVITDGEENASKNYTAADVKKRITHQEEKYSWEFVFIGANQNAITEAAKIGINWTKAITFQGDYAGTVAALAASGTNIGTYTLSRAVDPNAKLVNYTAEQRTTASSGNADLLKAVDDLP